MNTSTAQLHLWLAAQREPDSGRYDVPIDLEFRGPVSPALLRAALDDLLARHPQLRSRFAQEGGELVRTEVPAARTPWREHRLSGPYSRTDALRRAAALAARPLDPTTAPQLRADLLTYDDGSLLVLATHHLVFDGWSMEVFVRHLLLAYGTRAAGAVPALPAPFAAGPAPDPEEDAAYWAELLAGDTETPLPPADLVGSAGGGPGPAGHVTTGPSAEAYADLRALAEAAGVSPAVAMLGVFGLLAHAWSGVGFAASSSASAEEPADGLIGMPFAGRWDAAQAEEIGLWTRTLPVRTRFTPGRRLVDELERLADQVVDSFDHSAVPLEALPAAPRLLYAYVHDEHPPRMIGGARVTLLEHEAESAKHDLSLACREQDGTIELRLDHDTARYRRDTVTTMLDQLADLLALAADDPARTCGALIAGLASGAPEAAPHTVDGPLILDLVRTHAVSRPDAPAVTHDGVTVSYGELWTRASSLACWLTRRADPGSIVALLLPPGVDTVVAMVGVGLAGCAYLPLDPAYPDAQLDLILSDARPAVVLTTADQAQRVPGAVVGLPSGPPAPLPAVTGDLTCNVLYTSGSTGRPKGVLLPHAGLARLMARPDFVALDPTDVVSQLSPLNFDGASYEIWGALAHGASLVVLDKELVLAPRELRDAVRAHGVTTLLVTTPLLNRLIEDAPDLLQSLRRVYFGGELISVPHIRRALRWCGPDVLLHSYGPTENSFTATWHPIGAVSEQDRTVPIGAAVPGTRAVVVIEGTYDPAPPGVPGELLLGGAGVATGYLGDPRRTAQKYLPDPFSAVPGARLYRTGDRVRVLPDGRLEFVGRVDNQVKIRSQRVELGEVESVLRGAPGVEAAFVTVRRNAREEKEIVGYCTGAADLEPVRAALRAGLPAFAVPTHLVRLDALPLNPNGKIDRSRLPAPSTSAPSMSGPAPAAVVREPASRGPVREAWRTVLGHDGFGDADNFFEVGGHSLLVVKLAEALRVRTGHTPSVADLLRHTTVRAQTRLTGAPEVALESVTLRSVTVSNEPIAVVGMAGRFAGAPDLAAFWRNLRDGRDCITNGPEPLITPVGDGLRVNRWGLIADGLDFEAELFGFAPDEVAGIDPQHGIFYEQLWAAAEDAAMPFSRIGQRTALYAGRAANGNRVLTTPDGRMVRADDAVGVDPTFLATRFSYWHDLRGTSLMIDTACSTSLVAVHLAAEALRTGACDYALAGGVSVQHPDGPSYLHVPGQIYSRDGLCRPLDRRASGTVGGDGAGAVLLRRLSDAEADGDPVYAVILGSAANNDGRPRVGYSAPGVEGQLDVIRQALGAAGVDGSQVDYVEPHGTGTRLGDAIEATALTEALGPDGPPVHVGGLKASIGHTNTASGVAGFIKSVLAVHHGIMPATPHSGEPIEELGPRIRHLPESIDWPSYDRPRTAGISSFGVGGTNAHVVVQQYAGDAREAA